MVSIHDMNQKRHQATLLFAGVVVAAGFGWAVPAHAQMLLLVLVGLLLAAMLRARPDLAIHLTILAAATTLPVTIKTSVHPFGLTLDLWEPLIVIGVLYVRATMRPARWVGIASTSLAVVVLLGALIGWRNHNDSERLFNECRLLLDMIAAFYIAAGLAQSGKVYEYRRTLTVVLWVSALMLILASTTGLAVDGRQERTHLGSVSSEATRLLTGTQFVALAVLCAFIAVVATSRTKIGSVIWLALPCVVILFLSFSRNTLIALTAAALVTVVATRSPVRASVRVLVVFGVAGVSGWLVFKAASDFGSIGEYLTRQFDAYNLRVFGGIGSEARSTDPSALYRLQEDARLVDSFWQAPIFGHGFGYAYQPPFGEANSFGAGAGMYYAHNFYLWLLVKTGIAGAAVFAWVALRTALAPALRGIKAGSAHLGFVVAAASLLTVCYVAPIPLDSPGSLIIGAALGLAAGSRVLAVIPPTDVPMQPALAVRRTERGAKEETAHHHTS